MTANAAFAAALTTFLIVAWTAGELAFLAPFKGLLFHRHGWVIGGAVLLLFVSIAPIARGQAGIQTPAGYPGVGEAVRISMVSTGAEPRKPLRYVVGKDYKGHMNMDVSMVGMLGYFATALFNVFWICFAACFFENVSSASASLTSLPRI